MLAVLGCRQRLGAGVGLFRRTSGACRPHTARAAMPVRAAGAGRWGSPCMRSALMMQRGACSAFKHAVGAGTGRRAAAMRTHSACECVRMCTCVSQSLDARTCIRHPGAGLNLAGGVVHSATPPRQPTQPHACTRARPHAQTHACACARMQTRAHMGRTRLSCCRSCCCASASRARWPSTATTHSAHAALLLAAGPLSSAAASECAYLRAPCRTRVQLASRACPCVRAVV